MKDQLPSPDFDRSRYDRPNQDWECGWTCDGCPCRIGPSPSGKCRATAECRPVLEAMRREVGAEWLLWGTDMPFQNRFCTYRQSRTYLERHARDLFSPSEMAALMGGNAARLLRLAR